MLINWNGPCALTYFSILYTNVDRYSIQLAYQIDVLTDARNNIDGTNAEMVKFAMFDSNHC